MDAACSVEDPLRLECIAILSREAPGEQLRGKGRNGARQT